MQKSRENASNLASVCQAWSSPSQPSLPLLSKGCLGSCVLITEAISLILSVQKLLEMIVRCRWSSFQPLRLAVLYRTGEVMLAIFLFLPFTFIVAAAVHREMVRFLPPRHRLDSHVHFSSL